MCDSMDVSLGRFRRSRGRPCKGRPLAAYAGALPLQGAAGLPMERCCVSRRRSRRSLPALHRRIGAAGLNSIVGAQRIARACRAAGAGLIRPINTSNPRHRPVLCWRPDQHENPVSAVLFRRNTRQVVYPKSRESPDDLSRGLCVRGKLWLRLAAARPRHGIIRFPA